MPDKVSVMEYITKCPSHSRITLLSPKTRSKSGCIDSKSINVSLTSKISSLGFLSPFHCALFFFCSFMALVILSESSFSRINRGLVTGHNYHAADEEKDRKVRIVQLKG